MRDELRRPDQAGLDNRHRRRAAHRFDRLKVHDQSFDSGQDFLLACARQECSGREFLDRLLAFQSELDGDDAGYKSVRS